MTATLKDVATRSGYSIKTASRVINGEERVRPDTKRKVLQAIRDCGYIRSQAARVMRSGQSGIFGFITDEITTTPFSTEIVRGVQETIGHSGKQLLIVGTGGRKNTEEKYLRMFMEYRVEGIIYSTLYHRGVFLPDIAFHTKLIMVNCFREDEKSYPGISVVPDDYSGGYKAAEYLINLGHRNIAYITLEKNVKATVLRTQAMMDACYKHGITPRTEYIIEGKNYSEGNIACQTALNLLNRQKRPTAIICGNDEIALQVYGAAAQAGLSIPEKLSVIGFDDFRAISENIRPKLTTVRLPYYELGQYAVNSLINGQGNKYDQVKIDCTLVIRSSCAPPPADYDRENTK